MSRKTPRKKVVECTDTRVDQLRKTLDETLLTEKLNLEEEKSFIEAELKASTNACARDLQDLARKLEAVNKKLDFVVSGNKKKEILKGIDEITAPPEPEDAPEVSQSTQNPLKVDFESLSDWTPTESYVNYVDPTYGKPDVADPPKPSRKRKRIDECEFLAPDRFNPIISELEKLIDPDSIKSSQKPVDTCKRCSVPYVQVDSLAEYTCPQCGTVSPAIDNNLTFIRAPAASKTTTRNVPKDTQLNMFLGVPFVPIPQNIINTLKREWNKTHDVRGEDISQSQVEALINKCELKQYLPNKTQIYIHLTKDVLPVLSAEERGQAVEEFQAQKEHNPQTSVASRWQSTLTKLDMPEFAKYFA